MALKGLPCLSPPFYTSLSNSQEESSLSPWCHLPVSPSLAGSDELRTETMSPDESLTCLRWFLQCFVTAVDSWLPLHHPLLFLDATCPLTPQCMRLTPPRTTPPLCFLIALPLRSPHLQGSWLKTLKFCVGSSSFGACLWLPPCQHTLLCCFFPSSSNYNSVLSYQICA